MNTGGISQEREESRAKNRKKRKREHAGTRNKKTEPRRAQRLGEERKQGRRRRDCGLNAIEIGHRDIVAFSKELIVIAQRNVRAQYEIETFPPSP